MTLYIYYVYTHLHTFFSEIWHKHNNVYIFVKMYQAELHCLAPSTLHSLHRGGRKKKHLAGLPSCWTCRIPVEENVAAHVSSCLPARSGHSLRVREGWWPSLWVRQNKRSFDAWDSRKVCDVLPQKKKNPLLKWNMFQDPGCLGVCKKNNRSQRSGRRFLEL